MSCINPSTYTSSFFFESWFLEVYYSLLFFTCVFNIFLNFLFIFQFHFLYILSQLTFVKEPPLPVSFKTNWWLCIMLENMKIMKQIFCSTVDNERKDPRKVENNATYISPFNYFGVSVKGTREKCHFIYIFFSFK